MLSVVPLWVRVQGLGRLVLRLVVVAVWAVAALEALVGWQPGKWSLLVAQKVVVYWWMVVECKVRLAVHVVSSMVRWLVAAEGVSELARACNGRYSYGLVRAWLGW